MKLLLAIDGSPISARAVKQAVKLASAMTIPPQVTLLHADPPLLQSVAVKLGADAVKRYHEENSRHALRTARAALKRANLAFDEVHVVGEPGPTIIREAKAHRCELVIMGSHGHGALQNLLLGSVASKVLAGSTIPVLVVR